MHRIKIITSRFRILFISWGNRLRKRLTLMICKDHNQSLCLKKEDTTIIEKYKKSGIMENLESKITVRVSCRTNWSYKDNVKWIENANTDSIICNLSVSIHDIYWNNHMDLIFLLGIRTTITRLLKSDHLDCF